MATEETKALETLVIRESTRLTSSGGSADDVKSEIVTLLANRKNRVLVFNASLNLLNDVEHCYSVGCFIMFYLPVLSLAQVQIEQLLHKTCELSEKPSSYQFLFKKLKLVVTQILFHHIGGEKGACETSHGPIGDAPIARKIVSHASSFRVATGNISQQYSAQLDTLAPIRLVSDEEVIQLAHRRNRHFVLQRKDSPVFLHRRSSSPYMSPSSEQEYRDYIYQCSLECSEQDVDKYIRILSQLWDRYRTNLNVVSASSFLFKQMCDGYVKKIPFGEPYTNFRSISICFLPTMLEWIEADYLCIRHHVYDFLLTLGTHLQMVDSQNVYPGVTTELQRELVWLTQKILERQILVMPSDEMTWTAAAKCILATIPRSERRRIDCRVFVRILNITGLAELHPDTFGSFTESLIQALLSPADTKTQRTHGVEARAKSKLLENSEDSQGVLSLPNSLNKRECSKLGKDVLCIALSLYRRAHTVGARLWIFKLLFVLAAEQLRHTDVVAQSPQQAVQDDAIRNQETFESALQESLECFVAYGFFWYWQSELFYMSPSIKNEIKRKFAMSATLYPEYSQSIHAHILDLFIAITENDAALPETIAQQLPQISPIEGVLSSSHSHALSKAVQDGIQAASLLLKVDRNIWGGGEIGDPYTCAWRLLLYCAEVMRTLKDKRLVQYFMQVFVDCSGDSDAGKLRRVLPDLMTSILIQLRAEGLSPHDDVFYTILEGYLNGVAQPLSHHLLSLYTNWLGNLVEFEGLLFHDDVSESTDISFLLMDSVAVLSLTAVESLGIRMLWSLYDGLVTESALSACRARQVIVSILGKITRGDVSSGYLWLKIMEDPYPPVSLIGAAIVEEKWEMIQGGGDAIREWTTVWESLCDTARSILHQEEGR